MYKIFLVILEANYMKGEEIAKRISKNFLSTVVVSFINYFKSDAERRRKGEVMRRIILLSVMFMTALLFLAVLPVYANLTGYAVTTDSGFNVLYSVDLTATTATAIGSTGIPYADDIVEDLAINSSGNLFAITANNKLYSIDKTTGSASLIGDTGRTGGMEGLAFQGNVLYGIDFNGFGGNNQFVFKINTANAATQNVTELIPTGEFNINGPSSLAALNSTTMLFTGFDSPGSSFLYSVDLTTGATTQIGPIMVGEGYLFIGGLSFAPDGTLYGIGGDGNVVKIDPKTAAVTAIGRTGSQLWLGLAIPGARPLGALPAKQCTNLFQGTVSVGGVPQTEQLSMSVANDFNGCIIEASVTFYRSSDCTGTSIVPVWQSPDPGFVYKSGTRGGCPEAIEVKSNSPVCVQLTLASGRKTTVCY